MIRGVFASKERARLALKTAIVAAAFHATAIILPLVAQPFSFVSEEVTRLKVVRGVKFMCLNEC